MDSGSDHEHIFNMKLLMDTEESGWRRDYIIISDHVSKFRHIKIHEGRWEGFLLCSLCFDERLKRRINLNSNSPSIFSSTFMD